MGIKPILLRRHAVAVSWGTALQAGRSWIRFPMVSLELFIDNSSNRPVAIWLNQLLTEMTTRHISWGGVKAAVV